METTPEKNVPKRITAAHIGATVIYRIPHSVALSEGEITAISPEGGFYRIGDRRWLPNPPEGTVLSVLSTKTKKRASAFV